MAAAGDMSGSGAAGDEQRGPEGAGLDIVRSSSAWAALLLAAGSTNQVSISSFIATPHFERKPRTYVPRAAAPSSHWLGFKLPAVLPAAPAKRKGKAKKKRDTPCALCGAAETPLWRTWPTDRRVALCNACGIQVRTLPPGAVLPELLYLPHPATATAATTTASSELEQPVAPVQEIQPVKDSPGAALLPKQVRVNLPPPAMAATRVVPNLEQRRPRQQEIQESESESPPDRPILDSMLDADIYLVKRTSPRRREKSPPPAPSPLPPPTAEPEPAAAAPAPGNENDKQPETFCLHCGATSTTQWRLGPAGERTLCNPCGVRYMRGGLVPEYRPKESPSFDVSVHSNMCHEVLQIRRNLAHPAPPAAYQRVRARRKRRRNGKGQQQQDGKKRKKQNQPAAVVVLPVREKSKRIKAKEQRRQQAPQPAAATQLRAGNDMLLNLNLNLPPPPPPVLPNAGDGMEVDRHQLPALPPELPQHTAGNMEMEEQDLSPLPPPLALPHTGGDERMRDEEEPMSPPDPFLFNGPSAPMIIEDDDEPVEVMVIDDK